MIAAETAHTCASWICIVVPIGLVSALIVPMLVFLRPSRRIDATTEEVSQ